MSINQLTAIQGQLKILTEENYRRLRKELETVGFIEPVSIWENTTVDCTLYILNGHQRVETLRRMALDGWSIPQIPINWVEADDLEDAKRKVLALASQYGTVTKEGLSDFMADLNLTLEEFDSEFNFPEINVLELDFSKPKTTTVQAHERTIGHVDGEDDVPPEVPSIAKSGDIFTLGNHRLMCGDSTRESEVTRLMNGKMGDMVFTDPPYGVAYTGGHNEKKRQGIVGDTLKNDDLSELFYLSVKNAIAVTHDHAAFYIWYANGKAVETFAGFGKLPLKVRAVLCWYKVKSGLGAFMSQYIPNYEPCIYAHKAGCSPQWFGPTDEKTVWELKRDRINEYHPTQKPVELSERAILNSSNPDQIVIDLFGGSGATIISCEKTSRHCYMMEIDPHYCDVIIARWEAFTGQKAVRVSSAAPIKKGG